jgi:exodeoxyribonuclease VII small subunit
VAESKKKPTPARKLSFGEAVAEVEEILAALDREDVDIDTLGDDVKRAVELIRACREKLARTDAEVRELVAGLEADDAAAGDDGGDEPAGAPS